ncbi:FHA domain-containing protein [Actinospica robiniae]|uniref:FHA domain-containing protein n=1 Tax=Actinospica robiniae TaxID=304901 RepID=UPI000413C35A|nr:FHA domain-containing protein [Actinospica robiniae]
MSTCPAGHESQASDYCDTCGRVIGGPPASAAPVPSTATGTGSAAAGSAPRAGACPVCGAGRDGRFCEECGYDFDLAEAMPETVLTAGVGPAPAEAPVSQAPNTAAAAPAEAEQGLDLEAELARAEAQASPEASPAQPEVEPVPFEPLPDPIAGPIAGSASGGVSFGSELTLIVNADRDYYDAQVERGDIVASEFPFPKYPAERRFSFTAGPGPVRIGRSSSSRGLNPEIDLTGPPLDPAVSHLHAQLLKHDEGWVVVDLGSANGTRLNEAAEPLEAETEIPVKPGDRIHLGVWTTIVLQ